MGGALTAQDGTTATRGEIPDGAMTAHASGLRLDPRSKLLVLVAASFLLCLHVRLPVELSMVSLSLLALAASRRIRTAVRLGLVYATLLAADVWLVPVAHGLAAGFVSMLAVGFRTLMPCVIAGTYAFTTTTAGEFVCAMRKAHIPEALLVPCLVVMRFFPTIREDYRQIRAAMTLRGIASGRFGLFRHPAQSLEHVLMPLLVNASDVAQDLTVASLTKGLGLPGTHTCLTQIGLGTADWAYMVAGIAPLAAAAGGLW